MAKENATTIFLELSSKWHRSCPRITPCKPFFTNSGYFPSCHTFQWCPSISKEVASWVKLGQTLKVMQQWLHIINRVCCQLYHNSHGMENHALEDSKTKVLWYCRFGKKWVTDIVAKVRICDQQMVFLPFSLVTWGPKRCFYSRVFIWPFPKIKENLFYFFHVKWTTIKNWM
jgi:hypothetical protein